MRYLFKFVGWVGLIVLTMYITTVGFNLLNADNSIESLVGLIILILTGGFWFSLTIKGVKLCYENLKVYLE